MLSEICHHWSFLLYSSLRWFWQNLPMFWCLQILCFLRFDDKSPRVSFFPILLLLLSSFQEERGKDDDFHSYCTSEVLIPLYCYFITIMARRGGKFIFSVLFSVGNQILVIFNPFWDRLCYNFFLCDSHLLVLMLNCYFFQCFALNYLLLSFYNVYFIFDPCSGYFKFSNILKLVFFFVSIYHSMTCNVFSSFCLRKCFNS